MDRIPLAALARDKGARANVLRASERVPCVLYGNDRKNLSLECGYNDILRAYQKAGESTIVDLNVGDESTPVLFHEVQVDPVSDRLIHVDFYALDMSKEIEARVSLHFEGISPAVKDLGGVLVASHDHVTVRCLPANLPHRLMVALEPLVDFTSSLKVSDIVVPEGIVILDDAAVVVATVQEPRREEEIVPEVPAEGAEGAEGVAGEGTEGEGEGKGKEGEGAKGAEDSGKDS